jgi:hypothetical protein
MNQTMPIKKEDLLIKTGDEDLRENVVVPPLIKPGGKEIQLNEPQAPSSVSTAA